MEPAGIKQKEAIMEQIFEKLRSDYDGLWIDLLRVPASGDIKGIVQISHGMTEHKERYLDFMRYLSEHGYASVIHDHRGHGASIKDEEDLGYFYTDDPSAITEDLHQVTSYIKKIWPDRPVILFGHSMGSLVARAYIKKYDEDISGLILCGPPTKNPAAVPGLALLRILERIQGGKHRGRLIDHLTFSLYNKGHDQKNGWLSSDRKSVTGYNEDPLCGFTFTNNGFINLFSLLRDAYVSKDYEVRNPWLPVLLIAGSEDPVIQNRRRFGELKSFLKELGYADVRSKLYPEKRHELLNELGKEEVYKDVLRFCIKASKNGQGR